MIKSLWKRTMATVNKPKVMQPQWHRPVQQQTEKPVLKLFNSLTRTKEPFVPLDSEEVTWYSCGPTVYDSSHMGHARNYVSIDINRRILQKYFRYNVKFVQNVTDIDDKIIIRARQTYLFEQFSKELETEKSLPQGVISKIEDAFKTFVEKNLPEAPATAEEFNTWATTVNVSEEQVKNPKFQMYYNSAVSSRRALTSQATISREDFLEGVKDIISPLLDKERGFSVNDPEIFRTLPSFWERKYNEDMAALNVLPPDVVTRVSEYVPKIVTFVEQIISNGYAYATKDGSVYFNTVSFDKADSHDYAKLQPWNKGQLDLIADGEGSLTADDSGKRSPNDFALWKASKPGEPEWESPWGKGRPGWHIECSVMASDILSEQMDIHSGGIDLAFPHHDNELAQSEACFDNHQWVNYFLHTGHLHIEGQKMSKSLKNFITIQEALEMYTPRQLRLAFAFTQWNNQLDFKKSLLQEVKAFESSLSKFFQNVRALNNENRDRLGKGEVISKEIGELEQQLLIDLKAAKTNVNIAFCDNLATPQALKCLSDLVTKTNAYITAADSQLRIDQVNQVTFFVTDILDILGLSARRDQLGWEDASTCDGSNSTEDILLPAYNLLSGFRDEVRSAAIANTNLRELLAVCDKLRDDLLQNGVSLDDRTDGKPALIKFLSEAEKAEAIKFQEEKEKREEEKRQKKIAQQKLKDEQDKARLEKSKLAPSELFKTEQFSEWDEAGMPTKDKEGNEVTKSMKKKLQKQYDVQKKLHDEYLASQA